jgi:hypothetical protein
MKPKTKPWQLQEEKWRSKLSPRGKRMDLSTYRSGDIFETWKNPRTLFSLPAVLFRLEKDSTGQQEKRQILKGPFC